MIDPQLVDFCVELVAPAPTGFYVFAQAVMVSGLVVLSALAGGAVVWWRMTGVKGRTW